jgi:hypothetical protein
VSTVAAVRARALATNFAVHGVAATVRPGAPAAVITRGSWLPALLNEGGPVGGDFQKIRTRQAIAIPRSAEACAVLAEMGITAAPVAWVTRGEKLEAPRPTGGAAVMWTVDAVDQYDADHLRIVVVEAP